MKDDEITPALRLAVHIRDEFKCGYCMRDLEDAWPNQILLDHLEPFEEEPAGTPALLLTVCRDCLVDRQQSRLSWRHYLMMFHGPADGPELIRSIDRQRKKPVNLELAKAIIAGQTGLAVWIPEEE